MPILGVIPEAEIKSSAATAKVVYLDVLGLNIVMSDEATEELRDYMEKPLSLVDANGKLVYGLNSCRVTKYQMFLTSWHPLK